MSAPDPSAGSPVGDRDATDETFAADVLERSREVPVVVDFWADWCGPCRQLTPVLERAVEAREGRVELVKVDVDANPRAAATYGVRGIPAVKAFRGGRVVDEFTGAVPAAQVDLFLNGLLPSPADELAARGDEASVRRALELDPRHPLALGALARMELRASPGGDLAARRGLDALDRGEVAAGLDALLEALAAAEGERRDLIRRVMVGVFAELGQDHPVAAEYRRRLASALY